MAKNKDNSGKKKKKKSSYGKKLLSGPNAVAMKAKTPKENLFESIWSRRKFDIIGKKRKGEERRTGLARSRAIHKRKKTLLQEYEQSGKSSIFVDKRIGERNDALGEFDKAILRFQHERQTRLSKKSKYNLSDGEEDDVEDGSFTARDDFEDELSLDDDEDGETHKKSSILNLVNGHNIHDPLENALMDGEENKHKSKKEVMAEIILKSKQAKAEKAKEKEENEHLLEQLDKDFASLVQSQVFSSLTQSSKMNKGNTNEQTKKDELFASKGKESSKEGQPDAYDKLVKEMALDMRARPSDRTKTPEEIAQEEREKLERLEEERQKRMVATDYSSDEDNGDGVDVNNASIAKSRAISGDDLGDSFSFVQESRNKKGWVDEILERDAANIENEEDSFSEGSGSDESDSDQEGSEDKELPADAMSLKDWEQSDDENFSTDIEEEEEEEEEEEGVIGGEVEEIGRKDVKKKKDGIAQNSKAQKVDPSTDEKTRASGKHVMGQLDALPFVLEVPNSLAELCSLLDNRTDAEVVEGVNRIRACNAIRLAAENRKKMQVFYGILLQYFAVVANRKPLNFKLLNSLVKPLMEMSMDTPYFASICARQRLLHTRTQFCEDIKNSDRSCWPSLKTLLLLRLWSMIFPCSDFRHVVMTPAILLMCEYLMRCPITSSRDIVIGSFLCSMVLSVTRQSKKFCPEAIIFLQALLISALEPGPGSLQHSQLFSELKVLKPWLRLCSHVSEIHTLDFLMVMDLPEDSPFFSSDDFRAGMLISVVEALRGFVNVYEGHNSFPEIFSPISTLLDEVAKQEKMPDALESNMKHVAQLIKKKVDEIHMLRQPLQMRKQRPVPIKQLNPKFEENFVKGRDYDPDRDRAERKKLKRMLKKEAKGAARELRKDNYFLLEAKEKERKQLDEERAERYGKARAFLQEQEHAFKSGQLGKGSKRRR